MWFKKKSVLQDEGHYNTEFSADGTTDLRTTEKTYHILGSYKSSGLPSASDVGNYFYLPALGYYEFGKKYGVGYGGTYWSSSAHSWRRDYAYSLNFVYDQIDVVADGRYYVRRAEAIQ